MKKAKFLPGKIITGYVREMRSPRYEIPGVFSFFADFRMETTSSLNISHGTRKD